MDWKKSLILLFLFVSCNDIRDIEICQIDWSGQKGDCARNDDEYEVSLKMLDGYFAMSESDLRKILDKLQQCDQRDDEETTAFQKRSSLQVLRQ